MSQVRCLFCADWITGVFIISSRIWGWRGEVLTQLYSTGSFSPLGRWGRDGAELLGCGTAMSPKAAGTAAPSAVGTAAQGDVNGSKSLGWSKAVGCCWQSLEGFSYFKKCTTIVSLGLSECAVCTSALSQSCRDWGSLGEIVGLSGSTQHHFCSENWKPVKTKRKNPGNV